MPAVFLSYASAFKQSLNIAETIVYFAPHFHRDEYACLGPVVERGVTYTELLHHFGLGEEFLDGVVGGGRHYFVKDPFNEMVTEGYEIRILYCDVEISDTAFNECLDV